MSQPPYAPPGSSGPNPALIIGIVAVVAIVLGAGAFVLLQDDDSSSTTTGDTTDGGDQGNGSNGPDEPDFDELPDFPERTDPTDGGGSDPGAGIEPNPGAGTEPDPGTGSGPGTGQVATGEPTPPPTGGNSRYEALAQECHDGDMASCDSLTLEAAEDFEYLDYGVTCGGRVDPLEATNFIFCEDLDV